MQRQLQPSATSIFRGIIASLIFAAFVGALALSVLPQWHELFHTDAKAARHECAVTLVSSGNYQQTTPASLVAAPVLPLQFSFIPALHSIWVASPFIGARIFEHAPPALG